MPGKSKAPKNSGSKAKKVAKKEVVETPVVETPVVETPVVETPVVETPVVDELDVEDGYDKEFLEIQEQLKDAMTLLKTLTSHVSKLEKRVSRDRKVMNKKMRGKKPRVHDPNKPPSGFAKPGPISPELAKFLGLPKDELIARTEVTRKITEYCKKNDLQKKEDGRHILPDKALKKLLNINDGEELTFFNLQKYMKVHYPKKVVA
jgi:chromatin remodeling complex protein RSC6